MKSPIERARSAREQVVADHRLLRRLTATVLSAARDALRDPKHTLTVRTALGELRRELERHLDYEERVVAPLLHGIPPSGPRRVQQMTEDHSGQRAVLVALTEDANEGVRELKDLVDELAWFAKSLERDMEDEERALFHDDVLGVDGCAAGSP